MKSVFRDFLNKIFIRFGNNGKKRLFLVFGIFNMLVTNIILQILLFMVPTSVATIISQIFNFLIGYYLYGKKVFKVKKLDKFFLKKYLFLALILWILNFGFIESFFYFGVNKNLTALLLIPFLALFSYNFQNKIVFKKN